MKWFLFVVAALGGRELEGPQESVGLLEVRTAGVDLVNDILNADDTESTELLLDDVVGGDGDTLAIDLGESTLVDQLLDGLQVGETIGNVRLHKTQHLNGGSVESDEGGVVNLEKTEQLKNLASLGVYSVDTANTDNNSDLGLGGNVEVASVLRLSPC